MLIQTHSYVFTKKDEKRKNERVKYADRRTKNIHPAVVGAVMIIEMIA